MQILENTANETLIAETMADKPLKSLTVKVNEYSLWDRINRCPKERSFDIYRIRVCNMTRCAGAAYGLPELPPLDEINDMEKLTGVALKLVRDHMKDVVYLVACCIQNNSKEPKKSLIKFIENNFTADDLFDVLITCLSQLGLMSFTQAIQVLRGQNVNIVEAKGVGLVDKLG